MKRLLFIIPVIIILSGVFLIKVYADNSNAIKKGAVMQDKKVLVAYYSYSGNTKSIAQKIQNQTGGDIFEIKTVKEYPKNYNEVVEQAKKEKASDFKPELQSKVDNLKDYDVVFIGTPVWWYTMAPALKTFISENDLSGKTIVPFCTHGGGGESSTYTDIAKLAPNSKTVKGFSVYENGSASTDKDIQNWIKSLNL
ncbi:MAG: NAD(P)H-dependent oxidoreductase [Candidatus Gastranaerophilales bacterium]|nr:NAD(P)H-dependent oxidoreductase [Candidatus Gastranaerophilales bacterium]